MTADGKNNGDIKEENGNASTVENSGVTTKKKDSVKTIKQFSGKSLCKTGDENNIFKTYSDFLCSFELCKGTHVALFDERGDFGLKDKSSKTFVVSVSEIKDPKKFMEIALKYPKNTKGYSDEDSLKFNTSNDEIREKVIKDIAESGATIHVRTYHKDKTMGPDEKIKASRIHKDMIREVSDEMMKCTEAKSFYVVIDNTSNLRGNAGCKVVHASARNKKDITDCKQLKARSELILQTHDFIVGGIGHYEENDDDIYVKQLKDNVKSWKRL